MDDPTGKITFNHSKPFYPTSDGDSVFLAGKSYELALPSCERWKRRGFAADADAKAQASTPVPISKVMPETDPGEGTPVATAKKGK